MPENLPYRTRLWSQAVGETRRYWNSHRTVTAISSPVVTALFWEAVKGWRGWMDLLYALILGFAIFFIGWGIAFFVSLARAPVQLDDAQQKEIVRLAEKLELPNKAQADHLRGLMAKLDENGRAILNLAVFHDEVTYRIMQSSGLSQEVIRKGTRNGLDSGLLRHGNNSLDPMSPIRWMSDFYWISPEIREPIKRLLQEAS